METGRLRNLLWGQRGKLEELPPSPDGAAFVTWHAMTKTLLLRTLGPTHHVTSGFNAMRWFAPSNPRGDTQYFNKSREKARGYLDAALQELDVLAETVDATDDSGTDLELWAHIAPEVQAEAWGKAAREAVIFTEDRVRRWAGRPTSEISTRLAVTVFGDGAEFRLGREPGEKQGWQNFASGLMAAVRNVDAHRLQERPDHKRYALGVIGACSLLLTQMRHEHGNRFHDTSAVPAELGKDDQAQ